MPYLDQEHYYLKCVSMDISKFIINFILLNTFFLSVIYSQAGEGLDKIELDKKLNHFINFNKTKIRGSEESVFFNVNLFSSKKRRFVSISTEEIIVERIKNSHLDHLKKYNRFSKQVIPEISELDTNKSFKKFNEENVIYYNFEDFAENLNLENIPKDLLVIEDSLKKERDNINYDPYHISSVVYEIKSKCMKLISVDLKGYSMEEYNGYK